MNATLAAANEALVYGSIAAFAVAMVAFAAAAAGNREAPALEPVGAAGPHGSAALTADAASPDDAVPGPVTRASRAGRVGLSVTVLATALLGCGVLARGLAAGRPPWGNMYEFATTGSFVVAVAFLGLRRRYPVVDALAVWVVAVLLLTLGLATTVLYVPVGPLMPALHSYWLVIHVLAAIVAAAVFTLAMVASALQIVAERAELAGKPGRGYLSTLPSSAALDVLAYRVTAFAFPIWSFAVVAGAIWAEYSWGRYWGWDPKEVWALITWLAYAAYLHARATAGWRGSRASVVALVAYATLIFNFFGVNLFFAGLHSYGGL